MPVVTEVVESKESRLAKFQEEWDGFAYPFILDFMLERGNEDVTVADMHRVTDIDRSTLHRGLDKEAIARGAEGDTLATRIEHLRRSEALKRGASSLAGTLRSARRIIRNDVDSFIEALSDEEALLLRVALRIPATGLAVTPIDPFVSPSALLAFLSTAGTRVQHWYEKIDEWEDGIDSEMVEERFDKIKENLSLILQKKGMRAGDF